MRAILALPDVRLVYKPHPKVTTSTNAAIRDGHHAILARLADADDREPDAGHSAILVGDILAVMPHCDVIVTDVSSVGLDWLYLHTEKPDRALRQASRPGASAPGRAGEPVRRCHRRQQRRRTHRAPQRSALTHDEHHLARIAMRRHYFDDLQIGDSTARFLEAVSELVALRDTLLQDWAEQAIAT